MPSLKKHEESCIERFGKPFTEIHMWMDDSEALDKLGRKHRVFHHNPFATPKQARELFGINADLAVYDHILLDLTSSRKPSFPKTETARKQYITVCRKALEMYPKKNIRSFSEKSRDIRANREDTYRLRKPKKEKPIKKTFYELPKIPYSEIQNQGELLPLLGEQIKTTKKIKKTEITNEIINKLKNLFSSKILCSKI